MLKQGESGESKLREAQRSLDQAKREAGRTLAPILERMRKAHRIKQAESVVKRLSSTLEHPYRMRTALASGHMEECVDILELVLNLNNRATSLSLLQRIRTSCRDIAYQLKERCVQAPSLAAAKLRCLCDAT